MRNRSPRSSNRRAAAGLALLFAVTLALGGCQPSGGGDGEGEAAAALGTAEPESLETYLKAALREEVPTERVGSGETPVGVFLPGESVAITLAGADPSDATVGDPSATSSTNLQEAGVDEADLTKAGGGHLYVALPQTTYAGWDPRVVPGRPAVDPALPVRVIEPGLVADASEIVLIDGRGTAPRELEPARIRVLRLDEDSPGAEPVATIELSEGGTSIEGLYFLPGDGDAPDVLIVIASGSPFSGFVADFAAPIHWENGRTAVHWIDVSDPSDPQEIHRLKIMGRVADSRRIGDDLFLVSRHRPSLPIDPWPRTPEAAFENARVIDAARLDDLLPRMKMEDDREAPLVHPRDCTVLADPEGTRPSAALTTITQVALRSPGRQRSSCLAGHVESLYATTKSLYLTAYDYGWGRPQPGLIAGPHLRLHKFALTDGGAAYRATGRVPGTIWGRGVGESFRFGENGEVLGVMTTLNRRHPDFAGGHDAALEHRLTLLREAAGTTGRLEEVSRLPNEREPRAIGKPNESLYGVRFMGDRVYVVTYRRIDPLYILDVSDAKNPRIAGEVEVPGFSDYLHPVGETLLVGVGQETAVGDRGNDWFQGVKVELFDVSDPSKMDSLDVVTIGERGSYSAALSDHHAFTYLADPAGERDRFTIPVKRHDTLPETGDPESETQYYEWTDTGLHLFELVHGTTPSLEAVGALVVHAREEESAEPPVVGTWGDRSVIQGDAVHYEHADRVWSAPWDDPSASVGPE